jgi:predicted GTPase
MILKVDACDKMRKELEEMEPLAGLNIKQYNILLIGMIGAGKSSFFNTLSSVFSKKVIPHAPARDSATSVTNEVSFTLLISILKCLRYNQLL